MTSGVVQAPARGHWTWAMRRRKVLKKRVRAFCELPAMEVEWAMSFSKHLPVWAYRDGLWLRLKWSCRRPCEQTVILFISAPSERLSYQISFRSMNSRGSPISEPAAEGQYPMSPRWTVHMTIQPPQDKCKHPNKRIRRGVIYL